MSAMVTPASIGYPKRRKITLTLEISLGDKDQEEYMFESPDSPESEALQLGFVADLFDILNFEQSLGVLSINGETPETIKLKLQPPYGDERNTENMATPTQNPIVQTPSPNGSEGQNTELSTESVTTRGYVKLDAAGLVEKIYARAEIKDHSNWAKL